MDNDNNSIDCALQKSQERGLHTLVLYNDDSIDGLAVWKALIDFGWEPVTAAKLIRKIEKYGHDIVMVDQYDCCKALADRLATWKVKSDLEPI